MSGPAPFATEELLRAGQALLNNFLGAMATQADPESAKQLQALGVSATKLAALQTEFSRRHLSLWQSALARESAPAAAPRADRRFASAEWRANPWFDYLRRSYDINAHFLAGAMRR